jgi:hypothetical protein
MSIRNKALLWYKAKYGRLDILIYTSKFYQPEESWPKKRVWWPKIPIKAIEPPNAGYINILCQVAHNEFDFYHLKVPIKFFTEHSEKFHHLNDIISLYLSAEENTMFFELRGTGELKFAKFLIS